MTTYRKKLLDKDGNTIIPALAGDETGWVKTADLADGAVTAEKFAQYAVNNAVRTSGNLTPTADTPSYWINLFGTPGYYLTGYSGKCFTDQPTNYGVLETIFRNSGSIMQRYTSTVNDVYIRTGDSDGWHVVGSDSSFAKIISTRISAGNFLSSIKFKAGDTYTIVQTMTGQVRNLSNVNQNDIGYFTVVLPFEVDTGVTVSLNSFSIEEIENIGYLSTANTVSVYDSNDNPVGANHSHLTAIVEVQSYSRRTLLLRFKLKDGYHWNGARSYNAVQLRVANMTFTFSAAS